MKVILVSNFDDESVAESVLADSLNQTQADQLAKDWNEKNCDEYSAHYAVVKPDDYRLWRGMADLVGE